MSDHEAAIQRILSKAFKVPIHDYVFEATNRSLGLKRTAFRRLENLDFELLLQTNHFIILERFTTLVLVML